MFCHNFARNRMPVGYDVCVVLPPETADDKGRNL